MRVLLVDDDPDFILVATRRIEQRAEAHAVAVEIVPAYSAPEAIGLLGGGDFDLVLSDIRMPVGGRGGEDAGFDVEIAASAAGVEVWLLSSYRAPTVQHMAGVVSKDHLATVIDGVFTRRAQAAVA